VISLSVFLSFLGDARRGAVKKKQQEADHGIEILFTNSLQIYTEKVARKRFWQYIEKLGIQNLNCIFNNIKYTCTLCFLMALIAKEPNIFVGMNDSVVSWKLRKSFTLHSGLSHPPPTPPPPHPTPEKSNILMHLTNSKNILT
jgi:hypothetical protein